MMSAIKRFSARRWMLAAALLLVICASAPKTFASSSSEDEPDIYDARLLGYDKTVQLDSGSTALSWVLLIVLGVVTLGVLFKDAKRTHLD
jgi:hypothetical protein